MKLETLISEHLKETLPSVFKMKGAYTFAEIMNKNVHVDRSGIIIFDEKNVYRITVEDVSHLNK